MLRLAKIRLPNGYHRWHMLFIDKPSAAQALLDGAFEQLTLEHSTSDIFVDPSRRFIVKAPLRRNRWVDNLAKLAGLTPADKESRGAELLTSCGLKTPAVLARALPLNPSAKYRSLLYLEYLDGAISLSDYLRHHPAATDRQTLLDQTADELAMMMAQGVLFRDFHFGNLMRSAQGELYWIDTEVKHYPRAPEKAQERFLKNHALFKKRFFGHGGTEAEWPAFNNRVLQTSC
ncbi:lipopolysaccharide kinase InaA family protein [Motiliproteus sp. SC1-56]|uniref:lipopolysaccharide kinase InaA family protein n=1 Tax=Motiliproteus sp. SC1-56 TaxID=2799565 RepID=UPI001A8CA42D|nr:lipopolysaccharide kinase InaA family protein [Motiliproteus sp. SC1-56]